MAATDAAVKKGTQSSQNPLLIDGPDNVFVTQRKIPEIKKEAKTMRRRMINIALVAALGMPILGTCYAEEAKQPRKRFWFRPKQDAEVVVVNTLAFMDEDKDGVVTEVEFFQHVKTHSFRRLDADADGTIAKAEWLAVESGPDAEDLFARWDKNGDGNLTLKEFKDTPKAKTTLGNLFKTIDVDGDGQLKAGELECKED